MMEREHLFGGGVRIVAQPDRQLVDGRKAHARRDIGPREAVHIEVGLIADDQPVLMIPDRETLRRAVKDRANERKLRCQVRSCGPPHEMPATTPN